MLSFDHVAIECNNIPQTIAFYKDLLGAIEILYEDQTWAFLKMGETKIALVSPGEHPPHNCFRVENREELMTMAEKVNRPVKVHRDQSESFYMTDPSGNAIEILWYPPEE